jgi:hypothetical protein
MRDICLVMFLIYKMKQWPQPLEQTIWDMKELKFKNAIIFSIFNLLSTISTIHYKNTYLAIMLFSKILPINITLWNGIIRTDTESCVTDLDWKSIFKIQKAYLTNIFQFTTCLADLTFLISCITTRSPSKNSKWPCTNLALFVILSPRLHSHINII